MDLFLPIDVIGAPTVREEDGLAKSSRNGYLSVDERSVAPELFRVLSAMAVQLASDSPGLFSELEQSARQQLLGQGLRPDYVNIVNSLTLKPAQPDDQRLTILAAAYLGTTRLIDNISVTR